MKARVLNIASLPEFLYVQTLQDFYIQLTEANLENQFLKCQENPLMSELDSENCKNELVLA